MGCQFCLTGLRLGIRVGCLFMDLIYFGLLRCCGVTVGQGGTIKSDFVHQGQIWYSLGFEELGLGFDGE